MDTVSVTGPHALLHEELLFGSKRPPWLESWQPALQRIEQLLKEGQPIPYLLIAKLGYEIIIFYQEQLREKVRFSYAQEVFQIVANKIVEATPEGESSDSVHEFMSAFGPLITSACGAPPQYLVILTSEDPTHFGVHTPKESTQITVDVENVAEEGIDVIKERVFLQAASMFPANIQRALGAQPPEHNPISFF